MTSSGRGDGDRTAERLEIVRHCLGHDFRNSLAAVIGINEILSLNQSGLSEGERAEMREIIGESARKLLKLTRTLELVAAVEMLPIETQSLKPTDFMPALLEEFQPMLKKRGKSLRIEEPLPCVEAPEDWLAYALQSLVENAIEHGGPAIVLSGQILPGGMARLTIRDNGQAIPEGRMPLVFTALEDSAVRQRAGIGMGTTLTAAICRALGGSAEYARTNNWNHFHLTLPQGGHS